MQKQEGQRNNERESNHITAWYLSLRGSWIYISRLLAKPGFVGYD